MSPVEQVIKSTDLNVLRNEISLREDELQFHTCNPALHQRLHNEINQIRGKVYALITLKSKGKINFTTVIGLA